MNQFENSNLSESFPFHGHSVHTSKDDLEYREYPSNEKIDWHIGASNRFGAKKGYDELKRGFHLHPKINYNL